MTSTTFTPGIQAYPIGYSFELPTPPEGMVLVEKGILHNGDWCFNKLTEQWEEMSLGATSVGHPVKDFWGVARKKGVEYYRPKVLIENIMIAAASDCRSPAVTIAFTDALTSLRKIAQRAIHIQDTVIIEELEHLGIISFDKKEGSS